MDVVMIFNGLGNQMSQYAFYLAKKKFNPKTRALWYIGSKDHNGFELEKVFGIKLNQTTLDKFLLFIFIIMKKCVYKKIWHKILKLLHIRLIEEDKDYSYHNTNLLKGNWGINFYWGGWHSEKYFKDIKNEIIRTFDFNKKQYDIQEENFIELYQRIIVDENSVSVHIRRGDYLNIPNNHWDFSGICTLEYYRNAISFMKTKILNAKFYIFSNDIEWCKENFHGDEYIFVEVNIKENSWRDMWLMSLCCHHINANSSFSWWGAWLSKNKCLTVRPDRLLRKLNTPDYYPENWINISDITKV